MIKRNSLGSSISLSSYPPVGKGFLYRITVKRKGLPDAKYIGLTRRSIAQRRDEHIRAAKQEGILGPSVLRGAKEMEFPQKKGFNSIHAIIRTGMGITTTDEKNYKKYFTIEPIGEYSLFSLPDREVQEINKEIGIGGLNSASSELQNYDRLRKYELMNRTTDKASFWFSQIPLTERIIASYVHFRDENRLNVNNQRQLLRKISQLAYKSSPYRDAAIENVKRVLMTYLAIEDSLELVFENGERMKSISELSAIRSVMFRASGKGSRAYGGITPDIFEDRIKSLDMFKIFGDENAIYDIYMGNVKQPRKFKKAKDAAKKISLAMMKVIKEDSEQMILEAIRKNNKKY